MNRPNRESRMLWLVTGVLAGLCISFFWPHEPVRATTGDRDDKFAMLTVPVGLAISGAEVEGVFVLDFLTGTLAGGVLNKSGAFTASYGRNLAADFNVDPEAQPHYAFVSGLANIPSQGRVTMATGVVYVGELTSGKVIAYGFPYNETPRPVPTVQLAPLDQFQFRAPSN